MKRYILAAFFGIVSSLTSMQASGPEFITRDGESASAAETSVPVDTDRPKDSAQTNGILTGKPILRLDSRYGDIAVETIFGKVNGAQLRVTW